MGQNLKKLFKYKTFKHAYVYLLFNVVHCQFSLTKRVYSSNFTVTLNLYNSGLAVRILVAQKQAWQHSFLRGGMNCLVVFF